MGVNNKYDDVLLHGEFSGAVKSLEVSSTVARAFKFSISQKWGSYPVVNDAVFTWIIIPTYVVNQFEFLDF